MHIDIFHAPRFWIDLVISFMLIFTTFLSHLRWSFAVIVLSSIMIISIQRYIFIHWRWIEGLSIRILYWKIIISRLVARVKLIFDVLFHPLSFISLQCLFLGCLLYLCIIAIFWDCSIVTNAFIFKDLWYWYLFILFSLSTLAIFPRYYWSLCYKPPISPPSHFDIPPTTATSSYYQPSIAISHPPSPQSWSSIINYTPGVDCIPDHHRHTALSSIDLVSPFLLCYKV